MEEWSLVFLGSLSFIERYRTKTNVKYFFLIVSMICPFKTIQKT